MKAPDSSTAAGGGGGGDDALDRPRRHARVEEDVLDAAAAPARLIIFIFMLSYD
tara:strand:- start:345 stop:506 length:162 start_codon:yes stop_codon:yes gene_type:complete